MDKLGDCIANEGLQHQKDLLEIEEIYRKHMEPTHDNIWQKLHESFDFDSNAKEYDLASFSDKRTTEDNTFDSKYKQAIKEDLKKLSSNKKISTVTDDNFFSEVLNPFQRCGIIASDLNKQYYKKYGYGWIHPEFSCRRRPNFSSQRSDFPTNIVHDDVFLVADIKF